MPLLVLDIDGVLTDGRVSLGEGGQETKSLAYRDIDAVYQARREGIGVALVTGERSPIVDVIADRLGVETVISGAKDKAAALREVCDRLSVPLERACYVGDADRDAAALRLAGLGLAPADASEEARRAAHCVLAARGGSGTVAEAVRLIRAWTARESALAQTKVPGKEVERAVITSLAERITLTQELLARVSPEVATFTEWAIATFRRGGKLLLFGDAWNAADARCIVAERMGQCRKGLRLWPAMEPGSEAPASSAMTVLGMNKGGKNALAIQVQALGQPGDLAVIFSASDNSASVLAGAVAARERGLRSVGLAGADGGGLAAICDLVIRVPSHRMGWIQECHLTIWNVVCEVAEGGLKSSEDFGER